ncbi:hypothetical protein [Desulfosporosinus sp. SB140]|uniref:hypothetical protein n=1 Tax=Desulfosporosinus paludis TaxID=3115649 RepID=UPI00388E343D
MTHGRDDVKGNSEWRKSQDSAPNYSDWQKGNRGIYSDHRNDLHPRQAREIEAYDLCYDCETGFHYMK